MSRTIIFLALLLLARLPLPAQDTTSLPDTPRADAPVVDPGAVEPLPGELISTWFRVGMYGGYGVNFHDTKATVFTGGGECGAFSNGNGRGLAAGMFLEVPVSGTWLDLVAGATYAQRGGTFGEVQTGGLPVLDPNSGRYVELERVHRYTADLPYVLAELGVRMTPIAAFPIYLRLSGSLGIPSSQASHHQTEEILSPSGVLYPETNTTIRDVSAGPIQDVGSLIHLSGAIGYPFPLSSRLTASPEVSYYFPLNDVTPNYRWRIASAQGGIALRFAFGKTQDEPVIPPPPPPKEQPPAIAETPPQPTAVIAAVSAQKVEILETVVTETFPILPYIFFDSASAELPARYNRLSDTAGFTEQMLPHRSLGAYYHMLNVIGSRLARDPSAKITLNGSTDGSEGSTAGGGNNLARARAQGVKDYLMNVWGINPSRMAVTTSPLPSNPSSLQVAEGAEENRRVEIQSVSDNVLHPILFERFNEHSITPRQIAFSMSGASPAGIGKWSLDVFAGAKSVWHAEGKGTPPTMIPWELDLETAARMATELTGEQLLKCQLTVTDNNGQNGIAEYAQPARKSLSPFEISRLSLIVFDFDKATINTQNRRMISSFVAQSMQPSSTSTIVGSTDRLGELDHNKQLSTDRAIAVRDLMLAERSTAKITSVEGVGPSRLLYDNAVPEGRYYCRTVTVEMRTPIE
ncbi:MAG: OmpA family protein [Candidatus Kapaibacterium sp.]